MSALALDGARDENLRFVSATSATSKFADVLRLDAQLLASDRNDCSAHARA